MVAGPEGLAIIHNALVLKILPRSWLVSVPGRPKSGAYQEEGLVGQGHQTLSLGDDLEVESGILSAEHLQEGSGSKGHDKTDQKSSRDEHSSSFP